jgi:hypothetical protein
MIKQAGPTDKGYLLPSGQHWRFPVEPLKAGAIRIRTIVGDAPLPELCLYLGDEQAAHYRARISKDLKTCALRYSPRPEEVEQVLTTAPIELKPGQAHDLMLMSTSSQLWVTLDGEVILNAPKADAGAGRLALVTPNDAENIRLLKAEYVSLDGLSKEEVLKAAGVASSPPNAPNSSATTSPAVKAGQWIDATAEVKQNGLERNLLSVEGDWLIAKRGINYFPVSGMLELADAAVRVVFRGRVQVKLRQQPLSEKLAGYIASIGSGKNVGIGFTGPTTEKEWLKPDADLGQACQPDEEHELVFAVHGNHLIFGMDGNLVARVQDARFQKGKIEVATLMDQANDPNPTRIKKVEYMSLDGLSEAEALKAAGVGE